jgi:hypothetical protein
MARQKKPHGRVIFFPAQGTAQVVCHQAPEPAGPAGAATMFCACERSS